MTHSQTNTHKHYQQLSFSDRSVSVINAGSSAKRIPLTKSPFIVKSDTLKFLGPVVVDRVLQGFKAGARMIVRNLDDDLSLAVPFCECH